jgi:hypothetical protein
MRGRRRSILLGLGQAEESRVKHKATAIASSGVLTLLQNCPRFAAPACAWLFEVRDGTGYSGRTQGRYADALVCSLWPSRGIWLGGIEVKVSRSDWLKELADPTKSAAVQRYCDYWWIASPEGVVLPGEVPEQWGQIVVHPDASKTKRVIETRVAPKLSREAWSPEFLASVLRSVSATQQGTNATAYQQGYAKAVAEHDSTAVEKLEQRATAAENAERLVRQESKFAVEERDRLKAGIARFEADAGLPAGSIYLGSVTRWNERPTNGALFKALGLLRAEDTAAIADRLTAAADDLRAAINLGKVAAE